MSKITVVELFAGVGGFRYGIESVSDDFEFIFANQWEPNKKNQHAFDCYVSNFGLKNAVNENIADIKHQIPEYFDLLVGGFPCQDYSVAATNAKGIEGKKGVLWWEISWIIQHKKPKAILLENVDRLLKSPSNMRGRDFAIMLKNLDKLGYDVEWQVINAADYGMPQRRKRVFIWAMKRETNKEKIDFKKDSIFDDFFKSIVIESTLKKISLNDYDDELDVTNNFDSGKFLNKGYMINGEVLNYNYIPDNKHIRKFSKLKDILQKNVDSKFDLNEYQKNKMTILRGAKKILRVKPNGEKYYYAEGKMELFDSLDKPGRTMLTSENSINRSTHIIQYEGRERFITPIEAERLNGFPDNWTVNISSEKMRYFCMGNALVVDIIKHLTKSIIKKIK